MVTCALTIFLTAQVQQEPFVTNDVFLGITGFLFVGLLAILIYFVQRWIKGLDDRDERNYKLVQETVDSMGILNTTLVKVNANLELYQTTMEMTVSTVQQSLKDTCERASQHDKTLQDHEVRIQVIEGKGETIKKDRKSTGRAAE